MRRRLLASTLTIVVAILLLFGVPLGVVLDRSVHADAQSRLESEATRIARELSRRPLSQRQLTARAARSPGAGGRSRRGDQEKRHVHRQRRADPRSHHRDRSRPGHHDRPRRISIRHRRRPCATGAARRGRARASSRWAPRSVLALIQSAPARRSARSTRAQCDPPRRRRLLARDPAQRRPRDRRHRVVLDRSAERVEEYLRAERSFSEHASHQLRTALTGLQLRIEELAGNDDPDVREEAEAALEQSARLLSIIEELLALARTGRAGNVSQFDLADLVRQHVDDIEPVLSREGRRAVIDAPEAVPVLATLGAVGQVLDILLSNAVRHGAGCVTATVSVDERRARVDITDEGSGIVDRDAGVGVRRARRRQRSRHRAAARQDARANRRRNDHPRLLRRHRSFASSFRSVDRSLYGSPGDPAAGASVPSSADPEHTGFAASRTRKPFNSPCRRRTDDLRTRGNGRRVWCVHSRTCRTGRRCNGRRSDRYATGTPSKTAARTPRCASSARNGTGSSKHAEALHAGLLHDRTQRSGEPGGHDRQRRAGRDRGAIDHAVGEHAVRAVALAPHFDARRTPLALVAEPAAKAGALRRLAELHRDPRHVGKRIDEQAGRAGDDAAVATADRLGKEHRGVAARRSPRASRRRATRAPASGARAAPCRRSRDPPNPCARRGSRRRSRTARPRARRARRRDRARARSRSRRSRPTRARSDRARAAVRSRRARRRSTRRERRPRSRRPRRRARRRPGNAHAMTATSGGIASPGAYSIACTDGPSASATLRARDVIAVGEQDRRETGRVDELARRREFRLRRHRRRARRSSACSSEFGSVELAPTALGRRHFALAAHPCDGADGAGYAEHEQHAAKHFHGGQCK